MDTEFLLKRNIEIDGTTLSPKSDGNKTAYFSQKDATEKYYVDNVEGRFVILKGIDDPTSSTVVDLEKGKNIIPVGNYHSIGVEDFFEEGVYLQVHDSSKGLLVFDAATGRDVLSEAKDKHGNQYSPLLDYEEHLKAFVNNKGKMFFIVHPTDRDLTGYNILNPRTGKLLFDTPFLAEGIHFQELESVFSTDDDRLIALYRDLNESHETPNCLHLLDIERGKVSEGFLMLNTRNVLPGRVTVTIRTEDKFKETIDMIHPLYLDSMEITNVTETAEVSRGKAKDFVPTIESEKHLEKESTSLQREKPIEKEVATSTKTEGQAKERFVEKAPSLLDYLRSVDRGLAHVERRLAKSLLKILSLSPEQIESRTKTFGLPQHLSRDSEGLESIKAFTGKTLAAMVLDMIANGFKTPLYVQERAAALSEESALAFSRSTEGVECHHLVNIERTTNVADEQDRQSIIEYYREIAKEIEAERTKPTGPKIAPTDKPNDKEAESAARTAESSVQSVQPVKSYFTGMHTFCKPAEERPESYAVCAQVCMDMVDAIVTGESRGLGVKVCGMLESVSQDLHEIADSSEEALSSRLNSGKNKSLFAGLCLAGDEVRSALDKSGYNPKVGKPRGIAAARAASRSVSKEASHQQSTSQSHSGGRGK